MTRGPIETITALARKFPALRNWVSTGRIKPHKVDKHVRFIGDGLRANLPIINQRLKERGSRAVHFISVR